MKLFTYLNYGGNCAQAFRFYEQHLGGKITMMMTHAEQPDPENVPPEWRDAILHARMIIGETELLAADVRRSIPVDAQRLLITFRHQYGGGGTHSRPALRGWSNLHADAGDIFRVPLRHAPGQVWHILDDHPRTPDAAMTHPRHD